MYFRYGIEFATKESDQTALNNDWAQPKSGNGFGLSLGEGAVGAPSADDSSSSDEDEKPKVPMIEINMQGYGY